MQTTATASELRYKIASNSRAANHLLAEKGAQPWSVNDQVKFDLFVSEAEDARAALDARSLVAGRRDNLHALYREGLELFIRKAPQQMSLEEARKVRNTMSTTTGSQGGFAVMPVVAGELISLIKGYGYMRVVAKEITSDTGVDMSYATSDGTAEVGEVMAQNATATALDPSFGTVPVNTTKFGSKVFTVPIELLQDASFDIVTEIMERARDRIGRIQNTKFTVGTGTGEPTGLVTASGTGKVGISGQTLTIIYDDLADMIESVDEGFLGMPMKTPDPNAVAAGWMFSQTMRKVIRKVKDSSGRPIWTPSYDDGMTELARPQLLDYPVYINNDMPVPAANAKSLAFGNLGKYLIRDAVDVGLRRFDDSAYIRQGQVGFLAWARAGGNLLDSGAVKLYQHSGT